MNSIAINENVVVVLSVDGWAELHLFWTLWVVLFNASLSSFIMEPLKVLTENNRQWTNVHRRLEDERDFLRGPYKSFGNSLVCLYSKCIDLTI
jgi:hypothetical protein